MLSPERIERVGRAEGEIAAELQEALLRLVMANVRAALERGGMGIDALFRLSLDVQQQALREIARRNPEMVAEAARDVAEALAESMDDDLSRIGTTLSELPPHVAADMHRGAATTAQGVAEIVRRDNLSMADDARRQFLNTTSTHVSLVNAGQLTFEEAVRAACAELAASGVRCVDYASGQRADLDVAIRRHVRSQINQAGNRRTMQLMEECGVGFVEVSSHVGARPSHRAWQGRCYSLNGRQVIDGEVYEDFWEATGYQGRNGAKLGDQLCGVNCRHSFGPYLPGEPRAYSPTPDEDAGLDPDEAYAATQRQRELERRVRRAKRDAAAKEAAGEDSAPDRVRLGKAQAQLREHVGSHSHLSRDRDRERVQGLGRQPRGLRNLPPASSRARQEELAAIKTHGNQPIESEAGNFINEHQGLREVLGHEDVSRLAHSIDSAARSGDSTRENAANVFAKGVDSGMVRFDKSRDVPYDQFDPSDRVIYLRQKPSSPRMVAHEAAHAIDWQQSIDYSREGLRIYTNRYMWNSANTSSSTGSLGNLLRAECNELTQRAGASGQSVSLFVSDLAARRGITFSFESVGFLSDIIEGASGGAIRLGVGGHIDRFPNYWETPGALESESFANYVGSAIANPVEYELIRDLFPTSSAAMDELLEVIANV